MSPYHMVCWEKKDLDPNAVQNVESCFVDIRDQGWGNEGLIVGLAMKMGPCKMIPRHDNSWTSNLANCSALVRINACAVLIPHPLIVQY